MPRVLIVDDNQVIRRALRAMFVVGWIVCGEAENGEQAVAMAAALHPEVILLDFQMPKMNGLDAAKKILEANPAMPIAMYTLHQNRIFESAALACGVRKVISKADLFSALIPALQDILDEDFRNKS